MRADRKGDPTKATQQKGRGYVGGKKLPAESKQQRQDLAEAARQRKAREWEPKKAKEGVKGPTAGGRYKRGKQRGATERKEERNERQRRGEEWQDDAALKRKKSRHAKQHRRRKGDTAQTGQKREPDAKLRKRGGNARGRTHAGAHPAWGKGSHDKLGRRGNGPTGGGRERGSGSPENQTRTTRQGEGIAS